VLGAAPGPEVVEPRIVEANVFRSGIVMLMRETAVAPGTHTYSLKTIPQALDSTLWFESPDGAEVSDVRTRLELVPVTTNRPARTIIELIQLNVGKRIKIRATEGVKGDVVLAGTLLSAPPSQPYGWSGNVDVRLDDGSVREVTVGSINRIWPNGLSTTVQEQGIKPKLIVEFRTRSERPAHVRIGSLEAGALWNAAYHVDVKPTTGASVTAEAQLAVAGLGLTDSTTNLVTGMPDLTRGTRLDLGTGLSGLSDWLTDAQPQNNYGQPAMRPGGPSSDPYERLAELISLAQQSRYFIKDGVFREGQSANGNYAYYGGSGGYGGGGMGGFQSILASGTDDQLKFIKHAIEATRLEDLFTYPMGELSLKPGERLTRVLSKTDSTVQSHYVYSVDLSPGGESKDSVHRVLTIKNDSPGPWPGGTAFVTRSNVPLAEVPMPFTPSGKTADLQLATAEDLPKSRDLKEVSRESVTRGDGTMGQLVTYDVSISIENTRKETVPIDVELDVLGKFENAPDATIITTAVVPNPDNTSMRATWHFDLPPGDKKQMSARFKRVL
jgi:hypothetical protein